MDVAKNETCTPPVNIWSEWSFDGCTAKCGGGHWRHKRTCTGDCNGESSRISKSICNTHPCRSTEKICSKECDGGVYIVRHKCLENSNPDCKEEEITTTEQCNTFRCMQCYETSNDLRAIPNKAYHNHFTSQCPDGICISHHSEQLGYEPICPVCLPDNKTIAPADLTCCQMPPCYHMKYVTQSGKLLASQLANIDEMENTKYDGLCQFPVSLDENGVILDYQYCAMYDQSSRVHQAIKYHSLKLLSDKFADFVSYGITSVQKTIRLCRSGWSYAQQFVKGLTIDLQLVSLTKEEEKITKNGIVRNTYAQCNERMVGTWSEWSDDNHQVNMCSVKCGGGKVVRFRDHNLSQVLVL